MEHKSCTSWAVRTLSGAGKRAFIVDYHSPDGNDHFKIGFVNGLKDGNFTFWQDNGLALVSGIILSRENDTVYSSRTERPENWSMKNRIVMEN